MSASGLDPESDSEGDWEEVPVPEEEKNLEITIATRPAQDKKARLSRADQLLRTNSHKLHTLALLTNAWVRNKWINDPLLHARLLSLTPLSLQTSFAMIHKSRVPEQHKRGRMFETAMGHLVFWWAHTFFDVTFDGHLRNRTFDAVQKSVELLEDVPTDTWDVELLQEVLGDKGELIKGPKSLMKHALMQKGTRDTSAQLFTALCRALGIPARLVVSLQSVPWQSSAGKPKKDYRKQKRDAEAPRDVKGKGKAKADSAFVGDGQRLDGTSVPEKSEKAKGKEKAKPVIKLRKVKPQGNVLGSGPSTSSSEPDPATTPPVFWTEVFSRPDGRWFPVDPVRGTVNQTQNFDPSFTPAYGGPQQSSNVQSSMSLRQLSMGKFRKTISATSICTCRRCYPREQSIFRSKASQRLPGRSDSISPRRWLRLQEPACDSCPARDRGRGGERVGGLRGILGSRKRCC
ncbi:hypothetical protein B0H14DRAFT_974785 [Mycena olivaceomarginata]|nr:hypothetical protein B0H14DRAFT_974785 [Mycena olivaceomarginata]